MSQHVVFLERQSVKANVRRPDCAATYTEYDKTAPEQVVERLRAATVAIINKVVLRDATLAQLPKLKLIAMAATGYDCIEVDRYQPLRVDAEPAKPHAPGPAIKPHRLDIDLERHTLQPSWVAEMIEIAKEILDLEPDHRLAARADGRTRGRRSDRIDGGRHLCGPCA